MNRKKKSVRNSVKKVTIKGTRTSSLIVELIQKGFKTKNQFVKKTGRTMVQVNTAINTLIYQGKIIQGDDKAGCSMYEMNKDRSHEKWFLLLPTTLDGAERRKHKLKGNPNIGVNYNR